MPACVDVAVDVGFAGGSGVGFARGSVAGLVGSPFKARAVSMAAARLRFLLALPTSGE
uniref:Uncharacterized protein n=1 Tax=mine drainage metagenome TaxID=410659 RepID=E6Q2S9_9ZZZZ